MQYSDISRQKGKQLYCADGYRLKVIIACIMMCLCAMAVDILTSAVFMFAFPSVINSEQGAVLINAIIAAIIIVFITPMMFGINRMAFKRYLGEDVYVTSIFSAYKNLPRTWFVMLVGLLPAGVAAAVVIGCVTIWKTVSEFTLVKHRVWVGIPIYAAILLMGFCVLALTVLLWLRMFLLPAYAFRGDMSLWRAIACSARASHGQAKRILGFFVRYIGWLLLDILTLGVLLIIHTAPRFAADYAVFADEALHNTLK